MSDVIAYKSNDLVEASYKLTLQEQRLLLACIVRLRAFDTPAQEQKTLIMTASEFYSRFPEMGRENAERELNKAVDRLWERTIIIKGDKSKREVRWLQERAEYFSGEARVEMTFSDSVLPYLTQLKNQFTKIVLKNVSSLASAHSIRLYELLQQFIQTGDRTITLEDFRSALQLNDKYKDFKTLNRALLKPAIEELNTKSNLTVMVDTVKQGRKVVALHFRFKEDNQIKMALA